MNPIHQKFPWIKKLAEERKKQRLNNMSPREAYMEARRAGKRVPELEPIIMKHPLTAALYAIEIMQCRWEEAEPMIFQHLTWGLEYCTKILNMPDEFKTYEYIREYNKTHPAPPGSGGMFI